MEVGGGWGRGNLLSQAALHSNLSPVARHDALATATSLNPHFFNSAGEQEDLSSAPQRRLPANVAQRAHNHPPRSRGRREMLSALHVP